jgi:hypothetical protein
MSPPTVGSSRDGTAWRGIRGIIALMTDFLQIKAKEYLERSFNYVKRRIRDHRFQADAERGEITG